MSWPRQPDPNPNTLERNCPVEAHPSEATEWPGTVLERRSVADSPGERTGPALSRFALFDPPFDRFLIETPIGADLEGWDGVPIQQPIDG
jgi:hypothetical protein